MAKIEESLKRQDRLANRIRDVYSGVEHFEQSHVEMLNIRCKQVHQSKDWKQSPHWVLSFVQGVESELNNRIWQHLVEWVLIGPDGRMFRKDDDSWLKGSHVYKSSMFGFHVWKTSLAEGKFAIWC